MMFLELTLYFLIGLTGLFFLKIQSFSGFVKAVLFVILAFLLVTGICKIGG